MKQVICLLGILLLSVSAKPQHIKKGIEPLCVQGYFPDISLGKLINFKDSTAKRSSFGDKVLIFDFWGTHCGSCINAMPRNDSIQKLYGEKVQIVMVSKEPKEVVTAFLKKWELTHNQKFTIPMVVEDTIITQYFWHSYMPNYAWLLPDGKFMLQTSKIYINGDMLANILYGHTIPITNQNN